MGLLKNISPVSNGKTGWPWTRESPDFTPVMSNGREWPLITVVTPSFNHGEFIEETIRSVLLQNYPRLEYIIIDGGSNDNTINIIKKYELWISFWISESDRGQSHAINKGMLRSKGDIMCWINSDDWLKPGALKTVAEKLTIDVPAWLIGATELTTLCSKKNYIKYMQGKVTEKTFRHWNHDWIPQQSTFWNRCIWEKCGQLDESLHYAMDVDFLYRLFRIATPSICDEILACYRIHNNAKTINQSDSSLRETSEWIAQNMLKVKDDHKMEIIEYIAETIILQRKINRIRNHKVLGSIILLWQRFINKDLSL